MTRLSDIGLRAALLAAAACSGLMAATPSRAQPVETGWDAMSLEDLAGLLGGNLPRPMARPADFESTIPYLPRPRPRPYALAQSDATLRLSPPGEADQAAALAENSAPALAPVAAAEGLTSNTPAPQANEPLATPSEGPSSVAPSVNASVASLAPPSPAAPAAEAAAEASPAEFAQIAGPTVLPTAIPAAPITAESHAGTGAGTAPDAAAHPQTEPAPTGPLPLSAQPTAGYTVASYAQDRRDREAAFILATGTAKIAAALDLSQLLMSHMLLPEARSFHQRAQGLGVQLDPELHRRSRVQGQMLDVLQGEKLTTAMPEGWEDASLWAIAGKAPPGLIAGSPDLAGAIAALARHSEPVISHLLPELFDAALTVGDLHSADTLLRGAREATGLVDQPIYPLMMGRLALAYDLPEDAFDYFAKAAQGRDLSAQRARIAMADLALARKDPRLLPALAEILAEGVNHWRYGHEGLILRARLAQVAEDLGDIPLALDIMGRIRQDHPGTAEAILAHERGALALAAFAVAVDAREIGLETYLQSLRRVESFYRLDPVWPIARSALGRAFSRAGLHSAAAAEFAALQGDLQRLGAPVPPEAQRAAIPLDEAEAWLQNHNEARAQLALARDGLPKFADLAHRYTLAALKARVTGAVGAVAGGPSVSGPIVGGPIVLDPTPTGATDTASSATEPTSPTPLITAAATSAQNGAATGSFTTPDDLLTYAAAARAANQPQTAHQAHRALLTQSALHRAPAEALHAARIAQGLGDTPFADRSLADLRQHPLGATGAAAEPLGTALLAPMPALAPLSLDIAEVMLSRSGAALEASQTLLARPLLSPDALTDWERGRQAPRPTADAPSLPLAE